LNNIDIKSEISEKRHKADPYYFQIYYFKCGLRLGLAQTVFDIQFQDQSRLLNALCPPLLVDVPGPMYAYLHYRAMLWRGFPDIHILLEFHVVLMDLIVFLLIEEIGFFYTHWLFHDKSVRELIFAVHRGARIHPVLNKN
jgi:hypothetical protein